ncbi:hypothetical protein [Algoriphagus chordae]|uniref:Uncharacterized protein n=1 Tax=Algoriphagus chordae TaxID=237019 RepID=A0A2W7QQ45_9BACT|nr:hypothetical protein [Algoriphagus chordae]PZX50623.1 hypothetical protein LV85_02730 [Algoriphagus chordae]
MKTRVLTKAVCLAAVLFLNIGPSFDFNENQIIPLISLDQIVRNQAFAERMPPSCPIPELSYSLYNSTEKYCANENVWVSFEECEMDEISCCPGLSLDPEPNCYRLE